MIFIVHSTSFLKILEVALQRRSIKLVKGLQDIESEGRAELLYLNSLSCRMEKGDMILVYKIRHGYLEGVLSLELLPNG